MFQRYPQKSASNERFGVFIGALAAAVGIGLYWGFTVDDALIAARVARHLHLGLGYRFNASGVAVDAVTPFGWAPLLSPFATRSPWGAWIAARYIASVAWIAACGWLGREVVRDRGTLAPFWLIAFSAPLGAWAGSGMETGFIVALATVATGKSRVSLGAAGIAAALRPELVPFACVIALGHTRSVERVVVPLLIGLGPAVAVAIARILLFGAAYPLAVAAKPPDLPSGILYLVQTVIFGGPLWLWLGPGWKSLAKHDRWTATAVIAHLASVTLVGGDWMVLLRLSAPILPAAAKIATQLLRQRTLHHSLPSWVGAIAATAYLGWHTGRPGRHIVEQRASLVAAAIPLLKSARVVATLDVGWVGVAHSGTIVDLAGVTSPDVAYLQGGHTTKRIDASLLRARRVDHLLLLLAPGAAIATPWDQSHFSRGVEVRVAHFAAALGCEANATVALQRTRQIYLLVRCPGS